MIRKWGLIKVAYIWGLMQLTLLCLKSVLDKVCFPINYVLKSITVLLHQKIDNIKKYN